MKFILCLTSLFILSLSGSLSLASEDAFVVPNVSFESSEQASSEQASSELESSELASVISPDFSSEDALEGISESTANSQSEVPDVQTQVTALAVADSEELQRLFVDVEEQLGTASYEEVSGLIEPLANYVLYPYLQYQAYQRFTSKLSQDELNAFLDTYPLFPKRERLQRARLTQLARTGRWQEWKVAYNRLPIESTEYQCVLARAQLNTGDVEQGMALAEELWSVGKSQPDECDPVFERWMKAGNPTTDVANTRYWRAAEAGEMQLARYLHRFMSKKDVALANSYEALRRHSRRVPNADLSLYPESAQRALIERAFERLARGDAENASKQWLSYRDALPESSPIREDLDLYIGKRLAYVQSDEAKAMLAELDPEFILPELTESRLRQLLAAEEIDWAEMISFIDRLPESFKYSDRWLYWKASALDNLAMSESVATESVTSEAEISEEKQPELMADLDGEVEEATPELINSSEMVGEAVAGASESESAASLSAKDIWNQLAQSRSFYGFLAASKTGQPFNLNNEPVVVDEAILTDIRGNLALQRAEQLFALDRRLEATREWMEARSVMSKPQRDHLSVLASQLGWHHRAIMDAIYQNQWNYLDARFPALFEETFEAQASKNDIDAIWATAIARQESAFKANAYSPVGARGLMQLMPATARYTSRKHGVPLSSISKLYEPETNIALGTAYLAEMYRRFDDNRAYASAAYNAGPHRVERWLEERGHLPLDAWLETIPFAETRTYVQNVLAFRVIYAQRAGLDVTMLSEHERA